MVKTQRQYSDVLTRTQEMEDEADEIMRATDTGKWNIMLE